MARRKLATASTPTPPDPVTLRARGLESVARLRAKVAERTATRDRLAVSLRALLDDTAGGVEYARDCCDIAPQWARAVDLLEDSLTELASYEAHIAELDAEIVARGGTQ